MDDSKTASLRLLLDSATAVLDSMNSLLTGERSAFHFSPYRTFIRKYNQLVQAVSKIIAIDAVIETFDLDKVPGPFDTIGIQQHNLFYNVHVNLSILKTFLENKLGVREDRVAGLVDFVSVSLRKGVFREPERESDIQDAIEGLLIGRGMEKGIDYDRECGRVKVSIKEVIPDFNFPKFGLALEVKLSKTVARSKVLVDEINADIQAYRRLYRSIVFVVYDLGSIRDETEFKRDLEADEGVSVVVVKH